MTATQSINRLSVADGTTMQAYSRPARPAGDHASTGVIVAHELFAVNPDIRGVADDLAGPATSRSPRSSTTAMPRLAAGSSATRPAARRVSAT